jgi:peptidoglycan hydrolase CwlO-like protein
MWRFLLSAVAMTAALIVLFAGVLGDLRSLPSLSDQAIAIIGGAGPRHAPPQASPVPPAAPSPDALAEQQAARDALQREITRLQQQAGDLQSQIAQRSHELEQRSQDVASEHSEMDGLHQGLEAMRAETEKLRQDIDALRQQRKAEEDALARDKPHEKQVATVTAPRRAPAPADEVRLGPLCSS